MSTDSNNRVHFALTVIGKDRPGIVAGVAEVLFRLGCNVEDSSCTMLAGEFAMILVVAHDKPFGKGKLLEAFEPLCRDMGLSVLARTLKEDELTYTPPSGEICVVTVYGADRPGIVYRVAKILADRSINITDLNTRLVGSKEAPVYVLSLEAELPANTVCEAIAELFEPLKQELNIEIAVRTVTPVSL